MLNIINHFCILLFILVSLSCSDKETKINIKDHLENLPDGEMRQKILLLLFFKWKSIFCQSTTRLKIINQEFFLLIINKFQFV